MPIISNKYGSVECLGINNQVYYFKSDARDSIVEINGCVRSIRGIYKIHPDHNFWETAYKDRLAEMTMLRAIGPDLIGRCHKAGIYEIAYSKGTGFWLDNKQPVFNTGKELISENEADTKNYLRSKEIELGNQNIQALEELKTLLKNSFGQLNGDILTGWYVQSIIFPILPYYCHLNLTGSNSSTQKLNSLFLGAHWNGKEFYQVSPSKFRKHVGSDQTLALYNFSDFSTSQIADIVSLANTSRNSTRLPRYVGTPQQKPLIQNTRACFIFNNIGSKIRKKFQTLVDLDSSPIDSTSWDSIESISRQLRQCNKGIIMKGQSNLKWWVEAYKSALDAYGPHQNDNEYFGNRTKATLIASLMLSKAGKYHPKEAVDMVLQSWGVRRKKGGCREAWTFP